uniref:Uncharacterized protein n=1 Tax=Oryza sativa subsp. japonica TaxID=39947 RepID=Q69PT6_ORYSJ|nr:hypothetical protein [Oryza sativa Japonica Group]BAD33514.1 hypothetical protein [Oryza sativa Japonica Group]
MPKFLIILEVSGLSVFWCGTLAALAGHARPGKGGSILNTAANDKETTKGPRPAVSGSFVGHGG